MKSAAPPKPLLFFSVSLGEDNLAGPSLAQESVLSCGGQQIHRGRPGFWVEGSAITPQGALEAIIPPPKCPRNNPPTAIKNNAHKLFCQPIVLSHHIIARRVVLTSFAAADAHADQTELENKQLAGSDNNWRDGSVGKVTYESGLRESSGEEEQGGNDSDWHRKDAFIYTPPQKRLLLLLSCKRARWGGWGGIQAHHGCRAQLTESADSLLCTQLVVLIQGAPFKRL